MKHWAETDFELWLYGLKEADRHSEECLDCRREMERLQAERARIMTPPEVSPDFLAAQRRSIHRRLQEPRHNRPAWRWALTAAMLLAMSASLTLQRGRKAAPAISDEQLFNDLNAIEQSAEPKAIAPMHKLFEE